jgi:hypothetical protein
VPVLHGIPCKTELCFRQELGFQAVDRSTSMLQAITPASMVALKACAPPAGAATGGAREAAVVQAFWRRLHGRPGRRMQLHCVRRPGGLHHVGGGPASGCG